jgi:hypothetical protein
MTLAFVGEDGNPAPMKGIVTLFVGSEPKARELKNESSLTFTGIPSSFLGQKINLELNTDYSLKNDSAIGVIANTTIRVLVKKKDRYETPENSIIDISYEGGDLINFAPEPSKKNVVLRFSIHSKSGKIVPLSKKVVFQLLTNSGVPFYTQSYSLEDYHYVEPNNHEEIIVDLLIPKKTVAIGFDKNAEISFYYDPAINNTSQVFSQIFAFSKNSLSHQ